jgi:hypothetical protein
VLVSKLLAQRRAHDCSSNAGRGIEMRLARLSPRGVKGFRWSAEFEIAQASINCALDSNIQLLIFVIVAVGDEVVVRSCREDLKLFRKSRFECDN